MQWFSGSLFANIFIAFCGAGLLGLPYAFKMAGAVEGIVILVTVCCVSLYAMLLLVRAKDALVRRQASSEGDHSDQDKDESRQAPFFSYGDMGEEAMGPIGRTMVEIVLIVAHVGFCCAYLIFISKTLETITVGTPLELSSYVNHVFSESTLWVVLLSPPLVPLLMLPFAKLHFTSALADVFTLLSYAIVYYVDFNRLREKSMSDLSTLSLSRWRGIPFFASVAMYCYEGAGLVLSLEHSSYPGKCAADRRRHFPKMFAFSLIVITICYTLFGVAGYAAFGEEVEAVITKNLGPGFLAYSIKAALSVALYFTYPVVLHPVGQIADTKIPKRVLSLRIILVIFILFIVIAVPSFAFVMELVGGSPCSLISFVLPALFHYKIMRDELGPGAKAIDVAIVIFGVALGTICTLVVFADVLSGQSIHHVQSQIAVAVDNSEYLAKQREQLSHLINRVDRLKLGQIVDKFN